MRKIVVILCGVFLFLFSPVVLAKDTVYSLNQYDEEEFLFLLRGYQKDKKDGYIAAGSEI